MTAKKSTSSKKGTGSEIPFPPRIPFWSTKQPVITTKLGDSKYHFSGFHSQRVIGGNLVIDDLSLIGYRLDGLDLGTFTISLKEPVEAPLSNKGDFKKAVSLVLTSGSSTSTIDGEISGRLDRANATFATFCVSAAAKTANLTFGTSRVSSELHVALA